MRETNSGEDDHYYQDPLLPSPSSSLQNQPTLDDSDLHLPSKRTGTVSTAVAHIITSLIGSGVLSLAWSIAQLGWIAGPLCMLIFASITLFSTSLLSDFYLHTHPVHGPVRNRSYIEAVASILGRKSARFCGAFVQVYLLGVGVAYTITSATSIRAIALSNCYHKEGHEADCAESGEKTYMLLFGVAQIIMSQIPDLHDMAWLSIFAALMSFFYSFTGLGLGLAKVIGDGKVKGSISGVPTSTSAQKIWLVSQAIGDIAFSYPFSLIQFEIQDTLKSSPQENMKRASIIGVSVTTFIYLCCGNLGYAAFGNSTPGNLLTGFAFYEPHWLIDFANACVVIHLIGGYQVYSQPQFAVIERWFASKFPNSEFINNSYALNVSRLRTLKLNLFRPCFRAVYVLLATGLAMMFPYFNQVLGLLGAINFWALTAHFPVEMYLSENNVGSCTRKRLLLKLYSAVCLLITLFAFIGSLEGLISATFSSSSAILSGDPIRIF